MASSSLYTFIVPVYKFTRERERNFWFVLRKLLSTGCSIIIVEQKSTDDPPGLENRLSQSCNSPDLYYYNIIIDDNKIHKSRLINHGVSKATTPFVWVNDADCFLNFNDIIKDIDVESPFVRPFGDCINLTEEETYKILSDKPCNLDFEDTSRRHIRLYGALSFIFKVDDFISIGGMNEEFIGWGLEDYDLNDRVSLGYHVNVMYNHRGVHLYHAGRMPNVENWLQSRSFIITSRSPEDDWEIENAKITVSSLEDYNTDSEERSIIPITDRKIVHVVNLLDPDRISNDNLRHRTRMCLDSIKAAKTDDVILLGCVSDPTIEVEGWETVLLDRDARDIGDERDLAFLKDMIEIARDRVTSADYILYTNLDVICTPRIYERLLKHTGETIEYHRRDIQPVEKYQSAFTEQYEIRDTGVDGFAITPQKWNDLREYLPDVIIGEPHWDTILSGILKTHFSREKNTKDLYHTNHGQGWDTSNLTVAGKHNERHFYTSAQYGLFQGTVIDLVQPRAIIIIGPSASPDLQHNFDNDNIIQEYCSTTDNEVYLVEILDEKEPTHYPSVSHANHIIIRHTSKNTKHINQFAPVVNKIVNMSRGFEEYFAVTAEDFTIDMHHARKFSTKDLTLGDSIIDNYSAGGSDLYFFINDDGLMESTS